MCSDLETSAENSFSAEMVFVPFFNLGLQQSGLKVVYEVKLKNEREQDLEGLECTIAADPPFIHAKKITVGLLKAKEELALHDLDVKLDHHILATLSDKMTGKLKLEIRCHDDILSSKEYDVQAFAVDQWLGLSVMPELLASFVTPNLDLIRQLQQTVSLELKKATGSSALLGYHSDRTHVYEVCAAIYRAIHTWGIQYSVSGVSFGTAGQRIRFADSIYQNHLGSCLDTTLLFASVMECCTLHPVLILQKGHAYIGCHLVDRYFSDIPMDDLQMIRKLTDLDEFLVIETTMVTQDATFSDAEASARSKNLNVDEEFECAIDIVRARYSGITSIPLIQSSNGIKLLQQEQTVEALGEEQKRQLQAEVDLSKLDNIENRPGRVARWTQKLLDLSLRNRLLNVRDTKQIIPIACSDIALLEDKIASDEALSLNAVSDLLGEKDLHDLSMLRNREISDHLKQFLKKELSQHRLWSQLPPQEMNRRLLGLYRQGKTDLEEGGVNTLFLATGFLEWKVSERDEKTYLAPILLIPIKLQRQSVHEGIRILRVDEDTVINETLLELLRSQFKLTIPGMVPLPTDEYGVDVNLIMQIFRQTIKDMKGWEVREEARIGHFSFGKFIMWNDMTARLDSLKKNPLVNHLIEGGGIFDDGIQAFDPSDVGKYININDLYCPMSADSSQLAAVLYSQIGKSFVLHGPPGTGKSQTITNIIAFNLALGKRVLFVSEKKAALEVVHKRLSNIGLQPFCLELHSNKSGKTEVLKQFSDALNVPETSQPPEWDTIVQSMEQLRRELNGYVSELHRRFPNGISAYDCFSQLIGKEEVAPNITLHLDCISQPREEFDSLSTLVSDLASAWAGTTSEAVQDSQCLTLADWSPVYEKGLLKAAKELADCAKQLITVFHQLTEEMQLPERNGTDTIYQTAVLFEKMKDCINIPAEFLSDEMQEQIDFLRTYAIHSTKFNGLKEALTDYHVEQFRDLNFSGIASRIQNNSQSFLLIRYFKNKALLKELGGVKKLGGSKLTIAELTQLLPQAEAYMVHCKEVESGMERVQNLLGTLWKREETDWTGLDDIIQKSIEFREITDKIAGSDPEIRKQLLEKLQSILPHAKTIFAKESIRREHINQFFQTWNDFQESQLQFVSYAKEIQKEEDLLNLITQLDRVIHGAGSLRGAFRYRSLRKQADEKGLCSFADYIQQGNKDSTHSLAAFYDAFYREMLNQILAQSRVLCEFTGQIQNQRIQKFCDWDQRYTALSRILIFAKLASALPRRRSGPCPEGTELGILKRECEKKARQKPVRQLLELIPTLAPILKPCFLMSPLSVAQYLPPDTATFDLIVFDEASQIPVWDAIGVIARGKQLIVVGDPKQMPPTNFFQKGETEDDALPDETEDMESILDECIAAGVHSTYLNWHYRSRQEDLISFSNHYYYEDRLFTFPAARRSERMGIRFQFVSDGVYDRKLTRTNRKEAEALVKYVFEQLEKSGGKHRSMGIVTFSQAQKDLIEDRLEQERSKHPNLETYFSDQNEEPLFVKNLENVQGDERDVILFSICYAPDSSGTFSMNFGPLNRQGGERRLNVAITRAKEQVVVFSSIHAHQIDLSRSSAVGTSHLKYFLDYAEKGFPIQTKEDQIKDSEGLTNTIAEFLKMQGYQTERNVGHSGYRIDLAVRHPDKPEEFLLGIECDGNGYAAQKTTRDRDHLRASVLQGLGWHMYRAWSVDWAFDRERAESDLLLHIEGIRTEQTSVGTQNDKKGQPVEQVSSVPPESNGENAMPLISEHRKEYRIWTSSERFAQELFYDESMRETICQEMREVIQEEGPIYERLLKKRITKFWGFTRTGETIGSVLNACLPDNLETTCIGTDRVFWPTGVSALDFKDYRLGTDDTSRRSIDEIPPEELANAMNEVLIDFHSCEQDTLYRETVKLFGFSAVTKKARKYLDNGMQSLKESGRI